MIVRAEKDLDSKSGNVLFDAWPSSFEQSKTKSFSEFTPRATSSKTQEAEKQDTTTNVSENLFGNDTDEFNDLAQALLRIKNNKA